MTNLTQLMASTGCQKALDAARWLPVIEAAMAAHGIDTPIRKAFFLAQIGEESGGLTIVRENLNYTTPERIVAVFGTARVANAAAAAALVRNPSALAEAVYGCKTHVGQTLGNVAPGDGGKYLGRGLIQLTGKTWYAKYSTASGHDVLAHPEYLETDAGAADSAAWYWSVEGCNSFADKGDIIGLTKKINGGLTNLTERQRLTAAARQAFGC